MQGNGDFLLPLWGNLRHACTPVERVAVYPLHSLALLPTSFTEVITEERQKGIAYFRTLHVGDTSHLRMGGEDPSFACRFCEVYSDESRPLNKRSGKKRKIMDEKYRILNRDIINI